MGKLAKKNEKIKVTFKCTIDDNLASIEQQFENDIQNCSEVAKMKVKKFLYQNGISVMGSHVGESRVNGRKSVVLIAAENMNGERIRLKVDLKEDGDAVERLGSCISDGWKPVTVW